MNIMIRRMLETVPYGTFLVFAMFMIPFTCSATGAETMPDASDHSKVEDMHDLHVLQTRITGELLASDVDTEKVAELLATLKADGSWESVDYQDRTRAGWKTSEHLKHLMQLVVAYKSAASPLRSTPELKAGVFAGLDYWLQHDFKNPNWWHNSIGVPSLLGPVLLLLDDELAPSQRERGTKILERAGLGMSGANLVWVARICIYRGILERNPDLVNRAFKRIAEEIKITTAEGIQPDFSFHQHGPCLYTHGYGASFAIDGAHMARLAGGTRFAFSHDRTALLADFILKGGQWMTYNNIVDYGATGRIITRPGPNKPRPSYLVRVANDLLELPTGREHELKALVDRMADPSTAPLEGNRHFWRSDIMTHQREHYYTSARMYSTRVDNTDQPCNGEGLRSHYIADGCNYLFVSGDEYRNIFPIWDWHKIPGTTVEQTGVFAGNPRRKGNTDFVGGVSDGQYGLAVFDLARDGLRAHKAWFFFDREYVCLGAGITCPSTNPVLTTVNQCFLQGDVVTLGTTGETRLPKGKHRLKAPIAVHHDNVAYIFGADANLLVHNTEQTGSWHAISRSRSKDKIVADVFSLCVDHGANPTNSTYFYVVCPGMNIPQAKAYAAKPDVDILSNTAELQAVEHRTLGLTQMAFFKPGKLKIAEKTVVEVNKPCLVMVQYADHELRLSVSDPTQTLTTITVQLSGALQGDGCTYDPAKNISTVSLTLPTSTHAGQSMVRVFGRTDRDADGRR